jgi:hypothetical protein
MSKLVIALLAAAAMLIVGLAYGGYRLYVYVEHEPAFCGSCHIMEAARKTWQAGPHHQVTCHMCHRQNIVDRTRIVWHWAIHDYQHVPPHTRLNRQVCEGCHLSQDPQWPQIAATAGHKIHVMRADLQCLSCHLPSLHAVEPTVEACQNCHTTARSNIGGMAGLHCMTCHNFLAQTEQDMLPQRETCLTCHATMQVKGETFPEGAPMPLNCSECHKPHTRPSLQFQDCLGCHAAVLEGQAHLEHQALTTCIECHRPHSWRAVGWR